MSERELIGQVGVDTGTILIADPAYAQEKGQAFFDRLESGIDDAANWLGDGLAVVTPTAYGDGIYPVYAEMDDEGQLRRLVIDLRPGE